MNVLAAPFFLAAGLLVASGIGKLLRPGAAATALGSAGLPGGLIAARAVGALEVVAGAAALWRPGPVTAAAVAVLYLGFVAFLVVLLRRGDASTCGCVGAADAPPSLLHVALDLAGVAVALAVAVWPVPSFATVVAAGSAPAGVVLVVGLAAAGALLAVAVVEVPRAWRSYRPAHDEHAMRIRGPQPIALRPEPPR